MSVTRWMQSAKDKTALVAGERSSIMQCVMETARIPRIETQRTFMFLSLVKAKAQSVTEAAAAAAASATAGTAKGDGHRGSSATSRRFAHRPQSQQALRMSIRKPARSQGISRKAVPSKDEAAIGNDESHVESLTKAGWSPVAARLAMCKSGGSARDASDWLANEANTEEILAAEAAEMWAAEMLESQVRFCPSPAVHCTEDFLAVERCLFDGSYDGDDDEDNGDRDRDSCGLGTGHPQGPHFPTPERLKVQAPETPAQTIRISNSPGLYSRLYQKQEELENAQEVERHNPQKQEESKDVQLAGRPDAHAVLLTATTLIADSPAQRLSDATTQASDSAGQGNLQGCSEDEQDDGVDETVEVHEKLVLPEPPDGGSWEWPLTRHELKGRDLLLKRRTNQLENKKLIQALIRMRMSMRASK